MKARYTIDQKKKKKKRKAPQNSLLFENKAKDLKEVK